jgi:hypothetical protein
MLIEPMMEKLLALRLNGFVEGLRGAPAGSGSSRTRLHRVTTDVEHHLAVDVPEYVDRVLPKPLDAQQSTEDEVCPHGVALCARHKFCATVDVVQGRSHSLSDYGAFHLALIAFICVVMVLLSGSSPTRLAGTDWLTRQFDDRVEQIEAPNHTPVPMVSLDIRFAEGPHEEVAELLESTDDDETERCLLRLDAALRLDVPAFVSQTGLYESSANRALTPFRLRAFSSRGTPSA